jgi:GNAT superfamily N-acetyltransferase
MPRKNTMSLVPVRFRTGNPPDATTVAALSVQVFLDTYATDGVRPDLAEEAFAEYSKDAFSLRLAQQGRTFLLAERANGLLGFAEVMTLSVPPPGCSIEGSELVRLYVQPAAQRTGLGKSLLQAAEQLARSASSSTLWLTAWEGNTCALGFYEHMGYLAVGTATYTFQGRSYTNQVLAKRLRPGAA